MVIHASMLCGNKEVIYHIIIKPKQKGLHFWEGQNGEGLQHAFIIHYKYTCTSRIHEPLMGVSQVC